jgi:hypothetical protein
MLSVNVLPAITLMEPQDLIEIEFLHKISIERQLNHFMRLIDIPNALFVCQT